MNNYSDGQLYMRFLNEDDESAFCYIFEKYRDGLMLFLYGIIQNMDDAEELMMDTFAVLSSKTAHYKERENVSFKTWLYTIARNKARMFIRKNKVSFTELDDAAFYDTVLDISALPEETMLSDERNNKLYQAMKMLDVDYRQAIYLSYFEDMKPAEISKVMKKTIKQVYNLTSRGKAALRENLERMGYSWDI